MHVIILLARIVLTVVFGIAGIAKFADLSGSKKLMSSFGLPEFMAAPVAVLLPIAELVCAVALIPLATAWWGAVGVLVLLFGFIAGISSSLMSGRRPDCHCFGQIHSSPIGPQTLIRNALLAAVALTIVWRGKQNAGASPTDLMHGISGTEYALAGLAIAVAAVAAFALWGLIHVLRQNGRLLLRLEAVEAKLAGSVQAPPPPGLPVGNEAPAFDLPDLTGDTVSLRTLFERRKPLLLLFSEPGCGPCDALFPEVSQWQRDYRDRLFIVPISRGDLKENRGKVTKYGVQNILIQLDREIAESYQANSTPSAVLVKDGRVESSLAIGADEIRGLVARATLPPPVKTGDLVPSLRLPDLSGEMIDLAQMKSGRTVMLFWNPSCGFCQQMLEDLKKWEYDRQANTPELLIISTGGLDDNRKQNFQSRVLLDPYYAASQVFNSGGTPSALMVEQGRVASSVAVGAKAVLDLAACVPAGND